jgi:hypothetical protein
MPVVLVKIGTYERPPTDEEIENMQSRLDMLKGIEPSLSDLTFFVTRHDVEFDHYSLNPATDTASPAVTDMMSMLGVPSLHGMAMRGQPLVEEFADNGTDTSEAEEDVEVNLEEIRLEESVRENMPIVPDLENLDERK